MEGVQNYDYERLDAGKENEKQSILVCFDWNVNTDSYGDMTGWIGTSSQSHHSTQQKQHESNITITHPIMRY
jgi:hypothetical protein